MNPEIQGKSHIILFLSTLSKIATDNQIYVTPDGGKVSGIQTNVAPVHYLLKEHPEIQQIICLVTSDARKTAWEHFIAETLKVKPEMEFCEITYNL